MLSNTMAILLGIIEQQAVNAYELDKWLSAMKVREWYPIATSTVYATLKAAEKKRYISGNIEKAGNMPDKTVYSITPVGKKELSDTLRSCLSKFSYDITPFHIGLYFITALEHQEVTALLEQRVCLIQKYEQGILAQIAYLEQEGLPNITVLSVRQSLYIVEGQLQGAKEILKEYKTLQ